MIRSNTLKQSLDTGRCVFGCISLLSNPDVTEILALAGFDFIFIDQEHGTGGLEGISSQLRAAYSGGASALVRIPSLDPHYIRRLLDAGLWNIYCPMIENSAEAERFVEACFYPPAGDRGAGGGTRASLLGYGPDNPESLREQLQLIVAVESAAGVTNIREIVKVPNIDAIFIGARDLSASLGCLGQFDDPGLLEMIAECEAIIRESGKYMGAPIYSGCTIADMKNKGYSLILAGTDTGLLVNATKNALSV